MIKNLSFVLLILISFNSNAWWDKGHRMVCDEAYELLTVSAKKMIDPLIEEHGSFGTACLWADWVKNDDRKIFIATAQHYDDVYNKILEIKGNNKNIISGLII